MKRIALMIMVLLLCVPAVQAQDASTNHIEVILMPSPLPGLDGDAYHAKVGQTVAHLLIGEGYGVVEMEWIADFRLRMVIDVAGTDATLGSMLALLERPPVAQDGVPEPLLEFVDFSFVSSGMYQEGDCILTTAQVAYAESRLAEGEEPLAYDDYTCDDGTPAELQNSAPFVTVMTGAGIAEAEAQPYGQVGSSWMVAFTLAENNAEVDALLDYVAANASRPLAIVLRGHLISYPTIQPDLAASARAGTMDGGIITGNFNRDEARMLAEQLSSQDAAPGSIQLSVRSIAYVE